MPKIIITESQLNVLLFEQVWNKHIEEFVHPAYQDYISVPKDKIYIKNNDGSFDYKYPESMKDRFPLGDESVSKEDKIKAKQKKQHDNSFSNFIKDKETGDLFRSWIHENPKMLEIVNNELKKNNLNDGLSPKGKYNNEHMKIAWQSPAGYQYKGFLQKQPGWAEKRKLTNKGGIDPEKYVNGYWGVVDDIKTARYSNLSSFEQDWDYNPFKTTQEPIKPWDVRKDAGTFTSSFDPNSGRYNPNYYWDSDYDAGVKDMLNDFNEYEKRILVTIDIFNNNISNWKRLNICAKWGAKIIKEIDEDTKKYIKQMESAQNEGYYFIGSTDLIDPTYYLDSWYNNVINQTKDPQYISVKWKDEYLPILQIIDSLNDRFNVQTISCSKINKHCLEGENKFVSHQRQTYGKDPRNIDNVTPMKAIAGLTADREPDQTTWVEWCSKQTPKGLWLFDAENTVSCGCVNNKGGYMSENGEYVNIMSEIKYDLSYNDQRTWGEWAGDFIVDCSEDYHCILDVASVLLLFVPGVGPILSMTADLVNAGTYGVEFSTAETDEDRLAAGMGATFSILGGFAGGGVGMTKNMIKSLKSSPKSIKFAEEVIDKFNKEFGNVKSLSNPTDVAKANKIIEETKTALNLTKKEFDIAQAYLKSFENIDKELVKKYASALSNKNIQSLLKNSEFIRLSKTKEFSKFLQESNSNLLEALNKSMKNKATREAFIESGLFVLLSRAMESPVVGEFIKDAYNYWKFCGKTDVYSQIRCYYGDESKFREVLNSFGITPNKENYQTDNSGSETLKPNWENEWVNTENYKKLSDSWKKGWRLGSNTTDIRKPQEVSKPETKTQTPSIRKDVTEPINLKQYKIDTKELINTDAGKQYMDSIRKPKTLTDQQYDELFSSEL